MSAPTAPLSTTEADAIAEPVSPAELILVGIAQLWHGLTAASRQLADRVTAYFHAHAKPASGPAATESAAAGRRPAPAPSMLHARTATIVKLTRILIGVCIFAALCLVVLRGPFDAAISYVQSRTDPAPAVVYQPVPAGTVQQGPK